MKAKTIIMATLAASVLVACNNDENNVIDTESSKATFTAAIDGQVNTRAYDQTWEANDAIGISGTSGSTVYTNVQYVTTGGDGDFTVGTSGNEIYYQDDNAVTFTAYYPWNNLASGVTTITADTRAQASQSDFDFLWSQQTGSKASTNVQFRFSHKMAKLVLTIQKGNDVSYQEVQDAVLSLGGFKYSGTFNVTDGTTSTSDDLATGWTFAGNTSETGYNAPLKPKPRLKPFLTRSSSSHRSSPPRCPSRQPLQVCSRLAQHLTLQTPMSMPATRMRRTNG